MNLNEYQCLANRTAPYVPAVETHIIDDLRHAAMGACTEAGELMDILKRHDYYGKPIDWTHAVEEAGDLMWYCALVARAAGIPLEEIAAKNIAKLQKRFPDKFTQEQALNRNLSAEREALEK
jgi:NTP pyrophosphatase (non-canonical NTP hydrolase)